MHLFRASAERIQATTDSLRAFGIELIAPVSLHRFRRHRRSADRFGSRVVALRAGRSVRVSEA